MKNTATLLILSAAIATAGCTSTRIDTPVIVHLHPLHSSSARLSSTGNSLVQLLDNDGNLYLTYWDKADATKDAFSADIQSCKKHLQDKKIFGKAKTINEIKASDTKPTLYVPLLKCIYNSGYNLSDKAVTRPSKFRLNLSRGYSSSRNYLPVGGKFNLFKKGAEFSEVHQSVKHCDAIASAQPNQGINEINDGLFISVSIKVYADTITQCLRDNSYKVEPLTVFNA